MNPEWKKPTAEQLVRLSNMMKVLESPKKRLVETHIEENKDTRSYWRMDVYEDEHGKRAGNLFGVKFIVSKRGP